MGCIVAMLNLDGAPVERRLLESLMDVPPYRRRPDWRVATVGSVGLGFVPLRPDAIEAGTPQPFASRDGLWAVLDGRLDDRSSLVSALQPHAREGLAPASDVELTLRAYDAWGTDCAGHMIGDFAFCVWDERRRLLYAARDHMGVKPFYYARVGSTLIIGNALQSIKQHPAISGRLRDEAIGDLLLFGFSQNQSATQFADISRLPPAHDFTYESSRDAPRVREYWRLRLGAEIRYKDPGEYVEHFEQELRAAVKDRLREPRIGILMSGGLDSSSVAAMAVDAFGPSKAPAALRAYTAVYDTMKTDEERRYSSMAAEWMGIPIAHVAVDAYELFGRWNDDVLPPEPSTEPLSAIMADLLDCASTYAPAVLTGDGGDPLLLPSTVASQVFRVPGHRLARDVWRSVGRFRVRPPLGLRSAVRDWLRPEPPGVPAWLAKTLLENVDVRARWEQFREPALAGWSPRGDALSGVLTPYWASTFEGQDPAATRRPVEVRHPFFDVRVVSFALRLPSLPWCVNKTILRLAARGRLPEAIRLRPKAPLSGEPVATTKRWTVRDAMEVFATAPGIDRYVDRDKFQSLVRSEGLFTDDEPGTVAAVGLATWLSCSVGETICS